MEYEFLIIRIVLLTNIVVFLLYLLDFKLCQKGKKIPTILMFLPVMAGFVGASVGNYAFDTVRNREKKISKFILGIVPAIFNWILVIIVYIVPQIILKLISRAIGIPLLIILLIL